MQEVFENMVSLREEIQENQKLIKEKRALLTDLTDTVMEYMTDHDLDRIVNVAGRYTVSRAISQRMPPLSMEFVQACLTEYMLSAGNNANATEAAAFVFEQRKAQKQAVARIQVRLQKNIVLQSGSVGLEKPRQPRPQYAYDPPPHDMETDDMRFRM